VVAAAARTTGTEERPLSSAEAQVAAAFERAFLVYAALEALVWCPARGPDAYALAFLVLAACVAASLPRFSRAGFVALFAVLLTRHALYFADASNHGFLELVVASVLALTARSTDEAHGLRAIRALLPIAIVWAGIAKLTYGTWWNGQFLAYELAHAERFHALASLVPGSELASLSRPGASYALDAPLLVSISRAVVAAELALPLLLFVRRIAPLAIAVNAAFLAAVASLSREAVFFALAMVLLSAFARPPAIERGGPLARARRHAVPALVASSFALVILGRAGLVPGGHVN
jgi:hypothetical protein